MTAVHLWQNGTLQLWERRWERQKQAFSATTIHILLQMKGNDYGTDLYESRRLLHPGPCPWRWHRVRNRHIWPICFHIDDCSKRPHLAESFNRSTRVSNGCAAVCKGYLDFGGPRAFQAFLQNSIFLLMSILLFHLPYQFFQFVQLGLLFIHTNGA